jgi:hypothetical protein
MAGEDHTDLFMKFHDVHDRPVVGESRAELSSNDAVTRQLLQGFLNQKFFEIDSFSMSAQVDDRDVNEMCRDIKRENERAIKDYEERSRTSSGQRDEASSTPWRAAVPRRAAGPLAGGHRLSLQRPPLKSHDDILREAKTQLDRAAKGSPVKEITFTRQVDIASKAFATGLKLGHGYQSAALIKRKGAGSKDDAGKDISGNVFLRIDFEQVLVTSLDWSDDEGEIKETCKFICKKIIVKYRPQLPSGKLGSIKMGQWEYTDKSQPSTGSR